MVSSSPGVRISTSAVVGAVVELFCVLFGPMTRLLPFTHSTVHIPSEVATAGMAMHNAIIFIMEPPFLLSIVGPKPYAQVDPVNL